MNNNTTKLIHINPQSKGSLGKSFESEFRTAWLDYHQIGWNGSDLDDRHHSFADRHPQQVQSYTLGNDDDSKSTLLGLFRSVALSDAPVHVIDCRAQADGLIVQALESLQLIDTLADLLVPAQQVPEVEAQPEPAAKPSRPKHPMLNLGE